MPIKLPIVETPDEMRTMALAIRANPVAWADLHFDIKMWRGPNGSPGQAELLESVFEHVLTVAPSGHSVGKTVAVPVAALLWMLSHPYSYVCVTGASWTAVQENIFPGLRRLVEMHPHFFDIKNKNKVHSSKWRIADNWSVLGFSPNRAENVQGWHARGEYPLLDLAGTLVIADEASALEQKIFDPIESLIGGRNHALFCGNPIHSTGTFVICIESDEWHTLRISSRNTPNCIAGEETIPGLATRGFCDGYLKRYGENSPKYKARILGIVPDQGDWTFLSRALIKACGDNKPAPWQEDGDLHLGIDVGESKTGDPCVLLIRGNTTVHYVRAVYGVDSPTLEGIVVKLLTEWPAIRYIYPDATGIGSPLADHLIARGIKNVMRVVGSSGARDHQYENCRTECCGRMKDAMPSLAIPKEIDGEPVLVHFVDEGGGVEYRPSARGRDLLEKKIKTRDRIGRSPDHIDALSFTYCVAPGLPAFPMLCRLHEIVAEPIITQIDGQYMLAIGDLPRIYHRPGSLWRGTWISRAGESACVWVHVDHDGAWAILDAVCMKAPLEVFWQVVCQKSVEHTYAVDRASATANTQNKKETHLRELLAEVADQNHLKHYPQWIEPSKISGLHGLDRIDTLLLAGIAPFPAAEYWANNRNLDRTRYQNEAILQVRPPIVYDAMHNARMLERPANQTDDALDRPEGLVADGGPIVRCLRMLAVSW